MLAIQQPQRQVVGRQRSLSFWEHRRAGIAIPRHGPCANRPKSRANPICTQSSMAGRRGNVGIGRGWSRDVPLTWLGVAPAAPAEMRNGSSRLIGKITAGDYRLGLTQFAGPWVMFTWGQLVDEAPREGFEPSTLRLTAACSTVELSGNVADNVTRQSTMAVMGLQTGRVPEHLPDMAGPLLLRGREACRTMVE